MTRANPQLLFVLEARISALRVSVEIDGVPAARWSHRALGREQSAVNPFIGEGQRSITVRATPTGTGVPALSLRLVRTYRQPDAEEVTLGTLVLPDPPTTVFTGIGPLTRTFTVLVDEAFGAWCWETDRASTFVPARDTAALLDAVERLHQAFSGRDVAVCLDLLGLKFEETARAMQLPQARLVESARAHYDSLFASDGWALRPLGPRDALTPVSYAEDRVLSVRLPDGAPIIQSAAGMSFELDPLWVRGRRERGDAEWIVAR